MSNLEALGVEFPLASAEADRTARFTVDSAPPLTCRFCGKHRRAWAGCSLPGHAKCIVTPAFMRLVLEVLEATPGLTLTAVAARLGTTSGTVRAWYRIAIDARASRRCA